MIYVGRKKCPFVGEVNDGILQEFDGLSTSNGEVLDVGCGRAALAGQVRQRGWIVWGIEQDLEACARSKVRRLANLWTGVLAFQIIIGSRKPETTQQASGAAS